MPQARINGQNVEVTKVESEPALGFKEVTYTVSGDGAADLHAALNEANIAVSNIVNGGFTVTKTALTDDDMPFGIVLERRLASAASGLGNPNTLF